MFSSTYRIRDKPIICACLHNECARWVQIWNYSSSRFGVLRPAPPDIINTQNCVGCWSVPVRFWRVSSAACILSGNKTQTVNNIESKNQRLCIYKCARIFVCVRERTRGVDTSHENKNVSSYYQDFMTFWSLCRIFTKGLWILWKTTSRCLFSKVLVLRWTWHCHWKTRCCNNVLQTERTCVLELFCLLRLSKRSVCVSPKVYL